MCGIAGALDLTGRRSFSTARLLAMTGAIAHRGPDDEQVHQEPGLAMGVRRLSIVDLEGGRQPIANEDRTIWAAYNGELFNYPELLPDLLSRGHTLATRCDTEAWVHLYEDYGEELFEHVNGQFALALWDRKQRRLLLPRDRMGVCPLYYAEADGWLLWASEVKALFASGLVVPRPDPKGVDYFFNFMCAGTSRTFFEQVRSVPPGHYLRIQDGRVELRKYWDLDFPDAGLERRLEDPGPFVEELQERLARAVERRLIGDVPVVSYLSGGLDSTTVLGLTRAVRGEAVPSFTIGLDGAGPDERSKSAESAQELGSRLTTVTMRRADIAVAFPELITAAEGPVLDTSCACLLRLAQMVRARGYKVALTGEGSDEGLAGYFWFKSQKLRDALFRRLPGSARLARRWLHAIAGGRMRAPALKATPERAIGGVRPVQQDMFELAAQNRLVLYSDALWERLGDHDAYGDLDITNSRIGRWDPLNQSLYVAFRVTFAGLLMIAKGDRVARAASIETRYPFLDHDVITFCASIAPEYKLHGMTDKWILRQVAARALPPRIAHRPKTMFRASLSGTFLGPDRPAWVDQLLSPESLRTGGYFDPDAVARERAGLTRRWFLPSPRRFLLDVGLTSVITTQLWHHLYCGGGLCELPAWTSGGSPLRREAASLGAVA
jgi:asparagine synthase (glutamine-hydrolysing)